MASVLNRKPQIRLGPVTEDRLLRPSGPRHADASEVPFAGAALLAHLKLLEGDVEEARGIKQGEQDISEFVIQRRHADEPLGMELVSSDIVSVDPGGLAEYAGLTAGVGAILSINNNDLGIYPEEERVRYFLRTAGMTVRLRVRLAGSPVSPETAGQMLRDAEARRDAFRRELLLLFSNQGPEPWQQWEVNAAEQIRRRQEVGEIPTAGMKVNLSGGREGRLLQRQTGNLWTVQTVSGTETVLLSRENVATEKDDLPFAPANIPGETTLPQLPQFPPAPAPAASGLSTACQDPLDELRQKHQLLSERAGLAPSPRSRREMVPFPSGGNLPMDL